MAFALLVAVEILSAGGAAAQGRTNQFRVCADPNNLPYSNDKREGVENKLAELIAKELGAFPTYTWGPDRRGFIRKTLRAHLCDVVMRVPNGDDQRRCTHP